MLTLITELAGALGHIFLHKELATAEAGHLFGCGGIVQPAHDIEVVTAFCEQETRAAVCFAVPLTSIVSGKVMRHNNVLVELHRHNFPNRALV